jgi:hypothetical protein
MKILEKLNGLNGWQRIFFAFIVFIYLPIAVSESSGDRRYIDRLTDEQLLEITPKTLATQIANKNAFLVNLNDSNEFNPNVLNHEKFTITDYIFGYYWHYKLAINNDIDEATRIVMGEELGKALGNEYSKKSFWDRLEKFFFFLLGATAIYFFGWTLGWIKKGFKENKN